MKAGIMFSLIIFSVVVLSFVLFIQTKKSNNELNMAENEPQKTFDKNRICVSEKERIEREIEKISKESWSERLVEIFYSAERDTCLYVSEVDTGNMYWRILKRLVDFRSAAGSEPIDSCEYPQLAKIFSIESEYSLRKVEMGKELKLILEADKLRPYESWCGSFDKYVNRLKSGL